MIQVKNKHNAKIRMARKMMTNKEIKEHYPLFRSRSWFVRSMVRHQRELRKMVCNRKIS